MRRSGAGYSATGCVIGCLVAIIAVPTMLFFSGYSLLMHSSVPLRMIAMAANEADGITIEGIGGSISSGFTIDELRTSDAAGNESVMEGLSLKWQNLTRLKTSRELIIEEISLDRAHFYIDTTSSDGDETEADAATDAGKGESEADDSESLELFEIKKVDIREVVIESTTGDFKLELDEILMEGFRVQGDDFELKALTVGSNFVDLQLEDATAVEINGQTVPFKRLLRGTLKPSMHESLLREVDFTLEMGAIGGEMVTRVRMLDGTVEFLNLGDDGEQSLTVRHFTPADYFAAEWSGLAKDVSLVASSYADEAGAGIRNTSVESGEFTIGSTQFNIAPQLLHGEGPENSDSVPIVATGTAGDIAITATLEDADRPPYFSVSLESKPEREPRELMAAMLFEKDFTDLSRAQVDEVEKALKSLQSETAP